MRHGSAWLLLAALAGCGGSEGNWRRSESYRALGHDPAWTLVIDDGRVKFASGTPRVYLDFVRPLPQPTAAGRRYLGERFALEITARPCNDSRSGVAFADTVSVRVDDTAYQGCGGARIQMLDR
jgi:uncharacterized membrane protein